MRIALWTSPVADLLAYGFDALGEAVTVERHVPAECFKKLEAGLVDLALVPSTSVLQNEGQFDVLAGGALSTWSNPYNRLFLHEGLGGTLKTVAYHPSDDEARFVAKVLLKEHYGKEPSFIPYETATPEDLLSIEADACLVSGTSVPELTSDSYGLDVGQEWFEMANYPMVWGLFATLKGYGTPPMIEALVAATELAEKRRRGWVVDHEETLSDTEQKFFRDGLRLRLDDLAMASLTELKQFLYFYGMVDELGEVQVAMLPNEEGEDDDDDELTDVRTLYL